MYVCQVTEGGKWCLKIKTDIFSFSRQTGFVLFTHYALLTRRLQQCVNIVQSAAWAYSPFLLAKVL